MSLYWKKTMEFYDLVARDVDRNEHNELAMSFFQKTRVFANVNDQMILRDTMNSLQQQGYSNWVDVDVFLSAVHKQICGYSKRRGIDVAAKLFTDMTRPMYGKRTRNADSASDESSNIKVSMGSDPLRCDHLRSEVLSGVTAAYPGGRPSTSDTYERPQVDRHGNSIDAAWHKRNPISSVALQHENRSVKSQAEAGKSPRNSKELPSFSESVTRESDRIKARIVPRTDIDILSRKKILNGMILPGGSAFSSAVDDVPSSKPDLHYGDSIPRKQKTPRKQAPQQSDLPRAERGVLEVGSSKLTEIKKELAQESLDSPILRREVIPTRSNFDDFRNGNSSIREPKSPRVPILESARDSDPYAVKSGYDCVPKNRAPPRQEIPSSRDDEYSQRKHHIPVDTSNADRQRQQAPMHQAPRRKDSHEYEDKGRAQKSSRNYTPCQEVQPVETAMSVAKRVAHRGREEERGHAKLNSTNRYRDAKNAAYAAGSGGVSGSAGFSAVGGLTRTTRTHWELGNATAPSNSNMKLQQNQLSMSLQKTGRISDNHVSLVSPRVDAAFVQSAFSEYVQDKRKAYLASKQQRIPTKYQALYEGKRSAERNKSRERLAAQKSFAAQKFSEKMQMVDNNGTLCNTTRYTRQGRRPAPKQIPESEFTVGYTPRGGGPRSVSRKTRPDLYYGIFPRRKDFAGSPSDNYVEEHLIEDGSNLKPQGHFVEGEIHNGSSQAAWNKTVDKLGSDPTYYERNTTNSTTTTAAGREFTLSEKTQSMHNSGPQSLQNSKPHYKPTQGERWNDDERQRLLMQAPPEMLDVFNQFMEDYLQKKGGEAQNQSSNDGQYNTNITPRQNEVYQEDSGRQYEQHYKTKNVRPNHHDFTNRSGPPPKKRQIPRHEVSIEHLLSESSPDPNRMTESLDSPQTYNIRTPECSDKSGSHNGQMNANSVNQGQYPADLNMQVNRAMATANHVLENSEALERNGSQEAPGFTYHADQYHAEQQDADKYRADQMEPSEPSPNEPSPEVPSEGLSEFQKHRGNTTGVIDTEEAFATVASTLSFQRGNVNSETNVLTIVPGDSKENNHHYKVSNDQNDHYRRGSDQLRRGGNDHLQREYDVARGIDDFQRGGNDAPPANSHDLISSVERHRNHMRLQNLRSKRNYSPDSVEDPRTDLRGVYSSDEKPRKDLSPLYRQTERQQRAQIERSQGDRSQPSQPARSVDRLGGSNRFVAEENKPQDHDYVSRTAEHVDVGRAEFGDFGINSLTRSLGTSNRNPLSKVQQNNRDPLSSTQENALTNTRAMANDLLVIDPLTKSHDARAISSTGTSKSIGMSNSKSLPVAKWHLVCSVDTAKRNATSSALLSKTTAETEDPLTPLDSDGQLHGRALENSTHRQFQSILRANNPGSSKPLHSARSALPVRGFSPKFSSPRPARHERRSSTSAHRYSKNLSWNERLRHYSPKMVAPFHNEITPATSWRGFDGRSQPFIPVPRKQNGQMDESVPLSITKCYEGSPIRITLDR